MDLFLFPSPSNVVFHARGSDDTLTVRLDQNDHLAGTDKVNASGLNEAVQQAHFYTIQSSKIQRVQQPRSSQNPRLPLQTQYNQCHSHYLRSKRAPSSRGSLS